MLAKGDTKVRGRFCEGVVVPHVAASETHQRSGKISFVCRKRLFQQDRPNPVISCESAETRVIALAAIMHRV
jgi:hypothetical protein